MRGRDDERLGLTADSLISLYLWNLPETEPRREAKQAALSRAYSAIANVFTDLRATDHQEKCNVGSNRTNSFQQTPVCLFG